MLAHHPIRSVDMPDEYVTWRHCLVQPPRTARRGRNLRTKPVPSRLYLAPQTALVAVLVSVSVSPLLRTDEIDLDARRISFVGKGRKSRVAPIPYVLADVRREYLDELRPRLPASPYLFANPRGNRSLRGRYGARALHNLVVEAGTSAGVAGRHFVHRRRHSYATRLIRRGVDLHVIQRLMGHANIATTTRGLHLSDADLLAAIDRVFPERSSARRGACVGSARRDCGRSGQ